MTATRQRYVGRTWLAAVVVMVALAPASFAEDAKPAEDKVAPTITWNRADSMKAAAERIASLQRAQGPNGVYKFLDACYKTHSLASAYGESLESCIVQDYLTTKMIVGIYSQMPPGQLQKLGIPQPQAIADAMGRRIVTAFATYKIPATFGDDLKKDADKYGAPAFLAVLAPKKEEPSNKDGKAKQNEKPTNQRN